MDSMKAAAAKAGEMDKQCQAATKQVTEKVQSAGEAAKAKAGELDEQYKVTEKIEAGKDKAKEMEAQLGVTDAANSAVSAVTAKVEELKGAFSEAKK
mmetsp:Transcript_18311/g.40055  ORF Transcript_18311/g.40055 Transcript_18311/m.40055 type:complete len:97 (+) Transcript_18311:115-405(+)